MDASDLVMERCAVTGLYVGYIPGFAGAHAQGETVEELVGTWTRSSPCSWRTPLRWPAWSEDRLRYHSAARSVRRARHFGSRYQRHTRRRDYH
jgi:hypothetical protein